MICTFLNVTAENPLTWGTFIQVLHNTAMIGIRIFVWICGYKPQLHLILFSFDSIERDIRLSSGHQEASSVGLNRPEAEVVQLFLWLFKDNLHWGALKPLWAGCLCMIALSCRRPLSEIGWVYIYAWSLRGHFSSCTCVFVCEGLSWAPSACLSNRVQPLICSLLKDHEYAWQPYLPSQ